MIIQSSIKNICILQNPLPHKKKGDKVAMFVTGSLQKIKISFTLFKANWPETLSEFSDVWIIGGDGTLNYFLNKYRFVHQPLAIFKAGTGNDFFWKLYGNKNMEQQLLHVLSTAPQKVDIASCNNMLYANSAGFGFDGEVLRSMNAVRFIGGHAGYLGVVLKKIFRFKEFNFHIQASGRTVEKKCLLVIVNNSSRTGGGFMVTPKANINDGYLDMMLCKELSLIKRLRYLPIIEKGNHMQLPFISYSHEKEVYIKTEETIYAQLDGELVSGSEFNIQILPGHLSFRY